MPSPVADRNLLFGILALQMDFISREALIAAMHAWVLDKTKLLGHILRDLGQLSGERLQLLDALVEEHVRAHGDDAQQSLASLSSISSVKQVLQAIDDPELHFSLGVVGSKAAPRDPTSTVDDVQQAGQRFRILRPHARGGLGAISVAEDLELHREVALKEIQERHADDPYSRGRFLLEAEITGGLEHPGIVPVYSLGSYADGRPFYAMRFIKGDNLMEAIQRFHTCSASPVASAPGELGALTQPRSPGDYQSLAFRQLLGRFVDVCQAVAYAHSRGVLHRDLKPGNVMLGKFGETLVVDWGLAKAVGRSLAEGESDERTLRPSSGSQPGLTQAGSAVGTPAYMSPEQAAGRHGELGPASDVYSLGATLYVLLTAQAPFRRQEDVGETLRQVQRGEFPKPRAVKKEVPAALEAVCLKAMVLRQEDRYGTALALAAEVEHWLADEPVSACHEPLAIRARRWVRKHPGTASGAAAAVLVGLVGLAIGAALLGHANQQLVAANKQLDRARTDVERQNQQLVTTNEQLDLARKEAVAKGTQAARARDRTFQALDAMTSSVTGDSLETQPAISAEQKKFLADVLTYYREFAAEQGDDEGTRMRIAAAAYRVGLIHGRLGDRKAGVRAFEQACHGFEKLAADFPDVPKYREDLANSHNDLGNLFHGLGRWPEAEAMHRQALALHEKLATDFPAVARHRQALATSQNNLGVLLYAQGKRSEAEQAYRQALSLEEKLVADFPAMPHNRQGLARTYYNLAKFLGEQRKSAEAEAMHRQALALHEKLATDFPALARYRKALAESHNNLGTVLIEQGKRPEAEAAYRQALALRDKLAADFPAVPAYRTDLAGSQVNFGNLLLVVGKAPEALAWYDRAITLLKPLVEAEPRVAVERQYLRNAHWGRAEALDMLDRPADALADWDRTLDLAPAELQAIVRTDRAHSLVRAGQVERAVAEAADLAKSPDADATRLYDLARVHSLAASKDETNRAGHIQNALHLLRRAVEKGYKDAEHMKKDDDLKPLRDHEDFKKLLAELEKKPAKP